MADAIRYEGISELYRALRDLDPALQHAVKEGLVEVGDVTLKDAVERFDSYGAPGDRETHAATAAGLKVRVRAAGTVEIEQSKPKTTGRHPEYGSLVMTKALLPARDATQAEATVVLEQRVVGTLRDHGF